MRRKRLLPWPWVAEAVLVLSSCGGHPRQEVAGSVDSLPVLPFVEVTTLGGAQATGPAAFGSIRAAALLLPVDEIAVADGTTQQIHYFTLDGRYLRTVGGKGGGPEEYQALRRLKGLPDGSMCTWDVQTLRIRRLDREGNVMASGRADLEKMEAIRPAFVGFLDDCSVVLQDQRNEMGMRGEPEGMRRDSVRYALFSAAGDLVRILWAGPGAEQWFRNRSGSWGHVTPIFGRGLVGFVRRNELWLGESDSLRWSRHGSGGSTLGRVVISDVERVASEHDVEAERERRVAAVAERGAQGLPAGFGDAMKKLAEVRREGIQEVPAEATLPAYDSVVATTSGALWIRRYPRPEATRVDWLLVGGDGEPVGRVAIPRNSTVLDGSADWLVVATTDEWDTPVLRLLHRGASRAGVVP